MGDVTLAQPPHIRAAEPNLTWPMLLEAKLR
jgi:hypothetical protein